MDQNWVVGIPSPGELLGSFLETGAASLHSMLTKVAPTSAYGAQDPTVAHLSHDISYLYKQCFL